VPGGVSVKLVCVLAATAFVAAFRVNASADDAPVRAATTLSTAGAKALASDTTAKPAAPAVPRLTRVAALPRLRRAPAQRAVHRAPVVYPTVAATPVATPVPGTTVPRTAVAPRARAKPYVGKSFDSTG
jgi:hypothetical protein